MQYSIKFINNSRNAGNACIYQTDPTLDINVMSLAWLTKYSYPTTNIEFIWDLSYNFVWSETGMLKPGVSFKASQTWPADLRDLNDVVFGYDNVNKAYTFKTISNAATPGTLHIGMDGTVPINTTSTGIGMSGSPAFVTQAQPNSNFFAQPYPKYWITFGNYTHGEVLDDAILTPKALLNFPPNVYSMTATLHEDNTWSVVPG